MQLLNTQLFKKEHEHLNKLKPVHT